MSEHQICLMTGCDFLDPAQQRWIHGDLHQLMNILIFNASGCEWTFCCDQTLPDEMAVMCPVFYERNSQIVFPLELAQFNHKANAFLTKSLAHEDSDAPRIIRLRH